MHIAIRQEKQRDYKITETVIEKAFENVEQTDHSEHFLVARLRAGDAFIPELSLVAELDGKIVGHVMLTKLLIEDKENKYESLALAPVSVLPEYQNRGMGSKLIRESLGIAKEIGYKSVIVLGHDEYYPRFGFKPANTWGIKAPFEVPDESFMALELEVKGLDGVTGNVVYSQEFLG